MRKAILVVLAGLLASTAIGCVNIEVETLSPAGISYAPVPADSVRVFYPPSLTESFGEVRGGEPALLTALGTYDRIARLRGDGDGYHSGDKDVDDIIQEFRKKAGDLGANAIYVESAIARVVEETCSSNDNDADNIFTAVLGAIDDLVDLVDPCERRRGRMARARALAIRSESFFIP